MSPGVPVDARLVSAGNPLFHCPPETHSEGPSVGIGSCSWRFAKCRINSGHERARTGARGWWSHRILHPSSRCLCKSFQSCPTLCNPMDCSPPGSSVHEILQVRILEWVAVASCRGSSQPRDRTHVSYIFCTGRRFFTTSATWEGRSLAQWFSTCGPGTNRTASPGNLLEVHTQALLIEMLCG